MIKSLFRPRAGFAALSLLAAGLGCGLLDDATTFTIETGWTQLSVDADALGVTLPGATLPAVPCTKDNDVCALPASGVSCNAQSYGCSVRCGDQGSCEIVASAEAATTVDISGKVKNQTSASALSKVSLSYMLFRVTENTLTFDTPEIEIFVGPNAATTTTDTGVVRLATMSPITKGQKPEGQVEATEQGKAVLSELVKSYQTPFKIFVKASLQFGSGAPLPAGKLTVQVNGYFEVEPL